jgi:hypothetical protein
MTHIPKIIIKTIDPANQRFGECGDWFYDADADELTIFINKMADWRSELAVAMHEAIEAVMCLANEVDQTDVDYFDKKFYLEHDEGEAGNDVKAPYFEQHILATLLEKELCSHIGLLWSDHEKNCE